LRVQCPENPIGVAGRKEPHIMNLLKLGKFHQGVARRYADMAYNALCAGGWYETADEEAYDLLSAKFEKLLRRSNERREKLLQQELQQTMYCVRWQ